MTRFVLSIALLAVVGCSSIDAATRQAGRSAAANWGHEADLSLDSRARSIAHVNAVAWDVQYYCITGSWRSRDARRKCLKALGVPNEDALVAKLESAGD